MLGNPPELLCFVCSLAFLFPCYSLFHFFSPIACRKETFLFMLCSAFEELSSPIFSHFAGLFYVRHEYIRACCRRASSDMYYHDRTSSTASTAQHSTAQSTLATSSKANTRRRVRQRKPSDGVGSRQHVVEHTYSSLCSQNERRNQNLLGLQKYCWRFEGRRVCLYTALSLRPLYFVHTCGVRVILGTIEPWTSCAIRSFAFCSILCERA